MTSDDSMAPPHADSMDSRPIELAPTLDELHRGFLKTRDARYLVLAIGLCPQAPPLWATSACARLAADSSFRSGTSRRSPGLLEADERLLDDLVLALAEGLSPTAAARQLVSRALATHGERREPRIDPLRQGRRQQDTLGEPRTLQDAYELALREIGSGDLSTELDLEEEHTRQALSQWVLIEGPSPEDSVAERRTVAENNAKTNSALVRIAPRPQGQNLVRMVKAQLLAQRDRALGVFSDTSSEKTQQSDEVTTPVPLDATLRLVRAAAVPPSGED